MGAGHSDELEPVMVSERTVFTSPWLTLREVGKRMPSGQAAVFLLREEADVAVCLPVTHDRRFVLLREYRHGPGRFLFEIPGGNVDPGEDPLKAGQREAREECGYEGDVQHLGSTWIGAYSNARKHISLMRNARRTAAQMLAASDLHSVVLLDRDEFLAVIAHGALTDLDAALLCLKALETDNG